MARAVAQVKKQKMSVREAALEYGVKRSTLHHIVRGKVAEEVGRPNVLDKEEEKIIVERLLLMSEVKQTSSAVCRIKGKQLLGELATALSRWC